MSENLYTSVTIKEKDYIIKRFDAKTGLKLARLVIAKAAPLIPLLDKIANGPAVVRKRANDADTPEEDARLYEAVGKILDEMSDEDLDTLIDKCLRFCYVDLPAGKQPVIDELGNYGIEGVEYDMGLTLRLCFEAIKWGASDFFGENNSLSILFQR